MIRTGLPILAIFGVALCVGFQSTPVPEEGQLIVCGWDELYILQLGTTPRKIWSWKAVDRPELPEAMRDKFKTIDECKPVDDGKRILITASSNGAAVIDRAAIQTGMTTMLDDGVAKCRSGATSVAEILRVTTVR